MSKLIREKIRVLLVISLICFVAGGSAISNTLMTRDVWIYDNGRNDFSASNWFERANLKVGESVYTDVEDRITDIPKSYQGADWFQSSHYSRGFNSIDKTLVEFYMNHSGVVYIAHDDDITSKPDWLKKWKDTGDDIKTSKNTFSLFAKNFEADDFVNLYENGSKKEDMYFVVVKWNATKPSYKTPSGKVFNVLDYGAVADNSTLNTNSIQKAIDEASKNSGTVFFGGGGIFISGALEMKSNVTLWVEAGTILRGSQSPDLYPKKRADYPFYTTGNSYEFLFANKCDNISITGGGIIDGNCDGNHSKGTGYGTFGNKPSWSTKYHRPRIILFSECNNVTVSNITFSRPVFWAQLYMACNNVLVDGITVRAYSGIHNQDGIDISDCRGVEIKNSRIISGDDSVVIKALGMRVSKDIHIHDCNTYAHSAGIKHGTESHGGYDGVLIEDMVVSCERSAMAVESVDGAMMENITYRNIKITKSGSPIFLRLGNRGRKVPGQEESNPPGSVKNILIENITAINPKDKYGCIISGIPGHYIENVTIRNIDIIMKGEMDTLPNMIPPENEDHYPKSDMFRNVPAYGIYARHAKNISFKNIKIRYATEDVRPAIYFDDVSNYSLTNIDVQSNKKTTPSPIHHRQDGVLNGNK